TVPIGHIPIVSDMGVGNTSFRGLIPGTLEDLNMLNPMGLFKSFLAGSTPKCAPVTLAVVNNDNQRSMQTHYVTVSDITDMDPCLFPNRRNPQTGATCKEMFVPYSNPTSAASTAEAL